MNPRGQRLISWIILAGFGCLFISAMPAMAAVEPGRLLNPLTGTTAALSIPQIAQRIIKAAFGVIGVVSLVIFIYGGFLWMTAMGDDKKVKQGWDTMIWAGMGMVVMFGSYAIVDFILRSLGPTAA